jgi:hypothetical protein
MFHRRRGRHGGGIAVRANNRGAPIGPPASQTIMSEAKRSRRATSPAWCEEQYGLELARGNSHIASTLTPEGRAEAIAEVVDGFVLQYGETDLAVFLEVLATRLARRGAAEAAAAVVRAAQRAARKR